MCRDLFGICLIVLCWLAAGCGGNSGVSYRAQIQSEEPRLRIRAIVEAGKLQDDLAVPLIVDRLEDEDEGVRFYAILALEKITGERFGYDYTDPMGGRAAAVSRWRVFVRERVASSGTGAKLSPSRIDDGDESSGLSASP